MNACPRCKKEMKYQFEIEQGICDECLIEIKWWETGGLGSFETVGPPEDNKNSGSQGNVSPAGGT